MDLDALAGCHLVIAGSRLGSRVVTQAIECCRCEHPMGRGTLDPILGQFDVAEHDEGSILVDGRM